MKFTTKDIAYNAVLCACYIALTLISFPLSFNLVQFRFAELLILVCFFKKESFVGLTLGCAFINLFSPLGPLDAVYGLATTLISCLLVGFCKHLLVACTIPIIINSCLIGLELFLALKEPYWVAFGFVALGEAVVIVVGYIILMIAKRKPSFFKVIRATQNIDFKF